MYTKQDLISDINNELKIIIHLSEKVNDSNKDFAFSQDQRTIEKLLFYISTATISQIKRYTLWAVDSSDMASFKEEELKFAYTDFAEKIEISMPHIANHINSLTDEDMEKNLEIFWMSKTRKSFLVGMLTFLGAYKMQLFLQLKASWLSQLNTSNLRAWVDR